MDQLCVADDGYVYVSKQEDYNIAVDMESSYGSLDEVKSFIFYLAKHICELDNLVQRFNQKKRIKDGGRGYVCLPKPSRGFTDLIIHRAWRMILSHKKKSSLMN